MKNTIFIKDMWGDLAPSSGVAASEETEAKTLTTAVLSQDERAAVVELASASGMSLSQVMRVAFCRLARDARKAGLLEVEKA